MPHQLADLMPFHDDPVWDRAKQDGRIDFWLDMRWDAQVTLYLDVRVALPFAIICSRPSMTTVSRV